MQRSDSHSASGWAPSESGLSGGSAGARDAARQSQEWSSLLGRLLRALEGGSRQWTVTRRKESVHRLIAANRQDLDRLRERLEHLIASWDPGQDTGVETLPSPDAGHSVFPSSRELDADSSFGRVAGSSAADAQRAAGADATAIGGAVATRDEAPEARAAWHAITQALHQTVLAALPADDPRSPPLVRALTELGAALSPQTALAVLQATAAPMDERCAEVRGLLGHRQQLLSEAGRLCIELSQGLIDLAEDQSWAKAQADSVRTRLGENLSARSVRAAHVLLAEAREQQARVRQERRTAREALQALIPRMLADVAALDAETGRFKGRLDEHVQAVGQAGVSVEDIADIAQSLLEDTRSVHEAVGRARERMREEHDRASQLQTRVQALETELARLASEMTIDSLTRVANRRGLDAAFEVEVARARREGHALSVGLLDIDNFKKLNDTMGHAAGDSALQTLAQKVKTGLRPSDTVARFGGEEFVVLLPGSNAPEAQQVLTRLQRALSASLFLHESREFLVTFSAGVTGWRPGETLVAALERADEALYLAKRTGKNRTMLA